MAKWRRRRYFVFSRESWKLKYDVHVIYVTFILVILFSQSSNNCSSQGMAPNSTATWCGQPTTKCHTGLAIKGHLDIKRLHTVKSSFSRRDESTNTSDLKSATEKIMKYIDTKHTRNHNFSFQQAADQHDPRTNLHLPVPAFREQLWLLPPSHLCLSRKQTYDSGLKEERAGLLAQ